MEKLRARLIRWGWMMFRPNPLYLEPWRKERRRIHKYAVILLVISIAYLAPYGAEAAVSNDILPGSAINSPFYEKYDIDAYMIDYVPKDDLDVFDEHRIYLALAMFLNLMFICYVAVVEFCIRMVNWVFDTKLTNSMIDVLSSVMPDVFDVIWDNFWLFLFSVGFLGICLIFAFGNTFKSIQKLLALILIVALAPLLPTLVPQFAKGANEVSTVLGGQLLDQMVVNKVAQPKDSSEAVREEMGDNILGIQAVEKSNEMQVLRGVQAVDDSLVVSMIYKPFLIANFGSVDIGEKYADELLKLGDNKEDRIKYLKRVGEIGPNGVADNKEFTQFTADGIGDKFLNTFGAILFPGFVIVVLCGFSFFVLYWVAKGIGRGVVMVFHALIALWPGYGLQEAAQSTFQTLIAFLMKLVLTAGLSVVLAIWNEIQDPEQFPDLHLGGRVIVLALIILGVWEALKKLMGRLSHVPGAAGGRGIDTGMDEDGNLGKLAKTAGKQMLFDHNMKRARESKGMPKPNDKSLPEKASRWMKGRIPYMKDRTAQFLSPKQADVKANLSEGAANLYGSMIASGKNPTHMMDRHEWLRKNPDQKGVMNELEQWMSRPVSQMGRGEMSRPGELKDDVIPAPIPEKNTPEFLIYAKDRDWQNKRHLYEESLKEEREKTWAEYIKKKERFEQNSVGGWVRRMVFNEPQPVEPSLHSIKRRYKEKLKDYRGNID